MPPEPISRQTLRIIDANLNRIGEGLRVLEDLARFVLGDAELTRELKDLRHKLLATDLEFQQRLLEARDPAGDVGADIKEATERELPVAVIANARRVQEALRVMEELAKDTGLDSERFKRARFSLYGLEVALLSRLLRRDKTSRLSGVYVIVDTQALGGRSPTEAAGQAIRGGATVIQLRDKRLPRRELLEVARGLKELCAGQGVLFIVNDYLDIALASDADGLHLGQDDLPVKVARRLLAMDRLIGGSARTVEQAMTAESEGADYIAVGSIYPSPSKESPVVGLERLRQIRQAVSLPLVAIGGITGGNAAEVIAAGAVSVAVISAVLLAPDIEKATREMAGSLGGKSG